MIALMLFACAGAVDSPGDSDTQVAVDTDYTPIPVAPRSGVRLMNHVWDRYGPDLTRGLYVSVPPSNPLHLAESFPTGGNTAYADLFLPGDYDIGLTDADGAVVQTIEGLSVAAGVDYTVEVYGLVSVPPLLGHAILVDDNRAPADGAFRIRLFNAAAGTAQLDVYVDSERIADNIAYGTASAYVELPLGAVSFDVDISAQQPAIPQDGNPDYTCFGTIDASAFIAGRARVVHGTFAPGSGAFLGAILAYVDADYPDDPAAQEPIVLPCVPAT